ncbi:MAG: hypothetical protein Tsb0020_27480 [Haliangiales bacterium]
MSKRSPILGYNHNIRHRGLVFHVQTEDSGVDNPHVFTHLFHGGVILFSRRLDYDAGSDEPLVKTLMQAQHKAVLKDLKRGEFGDKIDEYLGENPDLEPRRARDTMPGGPAGLSAQEAEAGDTLADVVLVPERVASVVSDPPALEIGPDDSSEEEWPPAPSAVSQSEISDVFRVIMQPLPSDDDVEPDEDPWEERGTEEMRGHELVARREQVDTDVTSIPPVPSSVPPEPGEGGERRGPYGRVPAQVDGPPPRGRMTPRDTVEMPPPAPTAERVGGSTLKRHGQVPPPLPPPRGAGGHVGPRGSNKVMVTSPPIRVESKPASARGGSSARRAMAPRTVREDSRDSLFDQQTISEKSLDEVILAYLSEDAAKEGGKT